MQYSNGQWYVFVNLGEGYFRINGQGYPNWKWGEVFKNIYKAKISKKVERHDEAKMK